MAYIKTNWQDQKVERPHTYEANANPDGSFTLVDSFGNVEQMGTPVNAQNMNKIEEGIANSATVDLDNLSEVGIAKLGGGGMPVGTIFAHSASATFVPENSLPCDGTEYAQAQFKTLYNDWLVGKKLETCTYEEYQQEITATGECLKFALDTAKGMFKVPTKKNQLVSGVTAKSDAPVIGNGISLGLTNGEKNFGMFWHSGVGGNFKEGLFGQPVGTINNVGISPSDKAIGVTQDGSKSGMVADLSNSLDIKTKEIRYFVVVATGSIKQSEMDWSQWASGLQGKANVDLDNLSEIGKSKLGIAIKEAYVNGNSGYNIYSNGYCEQWGYSKGVVTFLKPFKDEKYCALGITTPTSNGRTMSYAGFKDRTATSINFFAQHSDGGMGNSLVSWMVCGYLPERSY